MWIRFCFFCPYFSQNIILYLFRAKQIYLEGGVFVYKRRNKDSLKTAALCALFLFMLLLHAAFIQANTVYSRADSISDSVLRLRVIANSDSEADQELKLAFKSRLCEILKPYLSNCETIDTAAEWIQEHLDFIQEQSDRILNELRSGEQISAKTANSRKTSDNPAQNVQTAASDSGCTVRFTKSLFPTRTYGGLTFPPGSYRTLLVTLGNGQGHNWWCVLYPSLCFTDETTAAFPEEAQTRLQQTLTKEDYETLTQGITLRLRIADLLENLLQ